MNAAAKTLSHGNLFRGDWSSFLRGDLSVLSLLLWLAMIFSALSVVYVRNLERHYVHELEQIKRDNNQLELQKAQLLLERSMWANPDRIRRLADQQLKMKQAKPSAVLYVPSR
jgi:cell division protein FtsL